MCEFKYSVSIMLDFNYDSAANSQRLVINTNTRHIWKWNIFQEKSAHLHNSYPQKRFISLFA
jgi:hypothetical protein